MACTTRTRLIFCIILGYTLQEISLINAQGTDKHDAEVLLKSDLLKNYTKDVLPPHNSTSPVKVDLALSLLSIQGLDPQTQTLTSEVWLKMVWNDSRLTWTAEKYEGISEIRLAAHTIWQPDVQLYNSGNQKEMGIEADVFVLANSNGKLLWVVPLTMHTLCSVELHYYPYDKHTCTYKFGSWTHAGDNLDVHIYGNRSTVDTLMTFAGGEWAVIGSDATRNNDYYPCCPEPYPSLIFSVRLQRRSPFYKAAVVCPVVAAVLLVLASFWISPLAYQRVTLDAVAFLAMVLFSLHFSSKLPAAGRSSPLIISFCGFMAILSALATALSVSFVAFANSKNKPQLPNCLEALLQSGAMKIVCIQPATSNYSKSLSNRDEGASTLVTDSNSQETDHYNDSQIQLWVKLFQCIDRVSFLLCLITLTVMLAVSSA